MRRILLLANPNAHRVTPDMREAIADILRQDDKLEEAQTERPGHAIELAREGVVDGVDLVVAVGGDGTVNEVANGLAGSGVAMAIVPGGLANVFARSLGVPDDPVDAVRSWSRPDRVPRRVNLGRIDGRLFTSNCGVGLDAAVVRRVEEHQRAKHRAGEWYFVWSGVRTFVAGFDRRRPHLRLSWGRGPGEGREDLFTVIVQNVDPYTYLRRRAMRLCPDAKLEGGLDCMALDSLAVRVAVPVVVSAFRRDDHMARRNVLHVHDRHRLEVESDRPMPIQADGEYLGRRDAVVIESVPDALAVLT